MVQEMLSGYSLDHVFKAVLLHYDLERNQQELKGSKPPVTLSMSETTFGALQPHFEKCRYTGASTPENHLESHVNGAWDVKGDAEKTGGFEP